jgi:hypothetical protein
MNTDNPMTEDDRIAVMLYVDGELAAPEQAAFDARLAHEPALANAVARERALRTRLQSAYAPMLDEPMPAGLLDLLAMPDAALTPTAANDVMPLGTSDAHRAALPHARRWRWPEWGAMAASLMLGVVFGARLLAPHPSGAGDTLALNVGKDGTITAQAQLRDALEQRVAGTDFVANSNVTVGLSFRNHAQQYCRTFTLDNASSGIACKGSEGWAVAHLEHATPAPGASAAGGYRTAASPFSPALLAAVDTLRDGETLDATAENLARAKGWKP